MLDWRKFIVLQQSKLCQNFQFTDHFGPNKKGIKFIIYFLSKFDVEYQFLSDFI